MRQIPFGVALFMNKAKTDPALSRHLKKCLPIACRAAIEAGEYIHKRFGKHKNLSIKPDTSLVTEVDKGSEKIVVRTLKKHFKSDHILAEETGATPGENSSSFRWHIDPLDGTTNFVHGFPIFCVSIGLQFEDADPVLGVIYQPMTGDLYTGYKGAGAFKNKTRIHVSRIEKLSDSLLSTGFSLKRERYFVHEMTSFGRMVLSTHAIRRTGSAALDLTFVASGQFEGFWERGLAPWDVTAALALLTEAGGTYSQINGKPYKIGDDSIAASNSMIHRELIASLNETSLQK